MVSFCSRMVLNWRRSLLICRRTSRFFSSASFIILSCSAFCLASSMLSKFSGHRWHNWDCCLLGGFFFFSSFFFRTLSSQIVFTAIYKHLHKKSKPSQEHQEKYDLRTVPISQLQLLIFWQPFHADPHKASKITQQFPWECTKHDRCFSNLVTPSHPHTATPHSHHPCQHSSIIISNPHSLPSFPSITHTLPLPTHYTPTLIQTPQTTPT